jgi:hypothetical protein
MENEEQKPKRKRKKKNIDITIDTKHVDLTIKRVDGVTDISLDTPIIDVDIHKKPNTKVEVDVKSDTDGMLALAKEIILKFKNLKKKK